MTDLAKLVVRLEAQSAQLLTELERANNRIDKFASQTSKTLQKWGSGLVAVFSADAILGFSKEVLKSEGDLVGMAQQAGTSVEKLSELGYAASKSGSDLQGLDAGLKGIANSAANVQKGSKDAAAAFAAIGVKALDANGKIKQSDELLIEIADAFAQYEDGAAKSALAQELFGKAGRELIPLLDKGSDGIKELTDEADRFGITVSKETAQAANDFGDELDRLGQIGKGIFGKALQTIVPLLNDLVGEFTEGAKEGGEFDTVVEEISAGFKILVTVGYTVFKVFDSIGKALGALAGAAVAAAKGEFSQASTIIKEAAADQIESTQKGLDTIQKIWEDHGEDVEEVVVHLDNKFKKSLVFGNETQNAEASTAIKALEQLRDSLLEQAKGFDDGSAAAIKYRLELGNLADDVAKAGGAGQKLKVEIIDAANAKQQKEDLKDIQEGLAGVESKIADIQGRTQEGALLAFDKENAELVKKLRREGNEAGLQEVDTLRSLIAAQAEFNKLQAEAEKIKEDLAIQEDRINHSQETGAISNIKAMNDLDEARKKAADQLDEIAKKEDAIAQSAGSDTMARSAKNAAHEVENLRAETDLLAKKVKTTFEDAFANAFAGFISGTTSAKDALHAFIQDVEAQFAELIARQLTQKLFEGVFGGTSTGSGSSGSSTVGIISSLASIFASRDSGGRGGPGQAYAIGTGAQPELFVPDHAGTFMPADSWMGGNVTQRNTFIVQARDGRVSMETQQQIATRTAQALAQARGRNA